MLDYQRLFHTGIRVPDLDAAYTYLSPPSGTIVELVTAAALRRFERWWSGGSLF